MNLRKLKFFLLVAVQIVILVLTGTFTAWAQGVSPQGSKGFNDSGILVTKASAPSTKSLKKKKRGRTKRKTRNPNDGMVHDSVGSQEDVTSQKEVSDQADQTGLNHKK